MTVKNEDAGQKVERMEDAERNAKEVEALNTCFAAACKAYQQGDFARAERGYLSLLEKFSDAPILHYNLGLVFFAQENFTEAVASFSTAASLAEDDVDILFNLALARKKQGDIAGAIAGFLHLLEKEPPPAEMVDLLHSLGGCYRQTGETAKAIDCYRRLLAIEKNHLVGHNAIAYLYHKIGDKERAISHYQQVLAAEPEHPGAGYMLAALCGDKRVSAPPTDYVRTIFDDYASSFEQSLVNELEYRAPKLLEELCQRVLPPGFSTERLLDLGCGTGLSGMAFAGMAKEIFGVDISEKMLEIAKEKNVYSGIFSGNIVEFLGAGKEKYSFFLACDVFNYFGELSNVFRVVAANSLPDAYLCFSTETREKEGFALGETGRFSHNPDYIRALIDRCDFSLLAEEKALLRKERGEWVKGTLWLAQCRGE